MPVALLFAVGCALPGSANLPEAPYRVLRDAYAIRDAAAASQAYSATAVYREDWPGQPVVTRRGQAEIEEGFIKLFAALPVGPGNAPLDLNFRLESRRHEGGETVDRGWYRLRHGPGETAARAALYGRFETRASAGRFTYDMSRPASMDDFETAPGPVMLAPEDEELAGDFYDRFLGTYRGPTGCRLRVTRSRRALFVFDHCTLAWRSLSRLSGLEWQAGASLLDSAGSGPRYVFSADGTRVAVHAPGSGGGLWTRDDAILREPVRFASDGLQLAGTILSDSMRSASQPGIVLVHGSGPQNRHGYASFIEFLAIELVESGFVVLTYDKRGTGASQGDWASADFAALAGDARAAMAALASHRAVDPSRIGLGGSSQAGWVAAKAIAGGADPGFVVLLGAAGAAMTVLEQNLYNTEVQMNCAGVDPDAAAIALAQQRAFFAARRDPEARQALKDASAQAAAIASVRPWMFPDTPEPSRDPQWYDVLDPDFDPLPHWANYQGRALFLFGGLDDSTDTLLAAGRLQALPASPNRRIAVVPGAQHLGLAADGVCDSLESRHRFDRGILDGLRSWARATVTGE